MRASGIDWLGAIPSHWSIRQLKHVVSTPITDGPHETPEFLTEGIPFVSAEAISSGSIDFAKVRGFISLDDHARYSAKYSPKRGDIYMVKSGATTGITAIVDTDQLFDIWSPLAAIRPGPLLIPQFLLFFMRSRNFQEAVALNWSFGTQQNIGMNVIESLHVPIPPLEEQVAIVRRLERDVGRFAPLSKECLRAVDLLNERRNALASAAITGQIDVREVASAKSA